MCFLFLSGLFKGSMLVCGVENWPSFIHCYYSIHRINIRSPVSTPVNPTEPLQVCLVFWSGSQTVFLRGTEMQGFGNAKKCLEIQIWIFWRCIFWIEGFQVCTLEILGLDSHLWRIRVLARRTFETKECPNDCTRICGGSLRDLWWCFGLDLGLVQCFFLHELMALHEVADEFGAW